MEFSPAGERRPGLLEGNEMVVFGVCPWQTFSFSPACVVESESCNHMRSCQYSRTIWVTHGQVSFLSGGCRHHQPAPYFLLKVLCAIASQIEGMWERKDVWCLLRWGSESWERSLQMRPKEGSIFLLKQISNDGIGWAKKSSAQNFRSRFQLAYPEMTLKVGFRMCGRWYDCEMSELWHNKCWFCLVW